MKLMNGMEVLVFIKRLEFEHNKCDRAFHFSKHFPMHC
jgi:hypothetical protein